MRLVHPAVQDMELFKCQMFVLITFVRFHFILRLITAPALYCAEGCKRIVSVLFIGRFTIGYYSTLLPQKFKIAMFMHKL